MIKTQKVVQRGNKGVYKTTVGLGLAFFMVSFVAMQFPPVLKKKVDDAIKSTYGVETFSLEGITVPEEIDEATKAEFQSDRFFKVADAGSLIGYIYVGEAPSMKKTFDYIIMFKPDWSILKSKVLIYREDYGLQIGSQRWLKQFIGLTMDDDLEYGKNIDAIAGATISAASMTRATDEVLKALRVLREAKIIQ